MGASLRHCVAFKREKTMMHNLDSVFALKPLISLTFTRTQGCRNVSNFGGQVMIDGVVPLYEANLGRANCPIGLLVPTPLDNMLVLDVQSAHVTKTGPRNRVGILLQSEMLKMDYFHNDIFIYLMTSLSSLHVWADFTSLKNNLKYKR